MTRPHRAPGRGLGAKAETGRSCAWGGRLAAKQ